MNTLRWAIYLGVSWTWCIGMYLPVLLVRDFGQWAFWVFALPNVLGAAAMPWVVRTADTSRELVARHAGPMLTFSRVTVLFQAFFAGWMLPHLLGWWTLTVYPLLVVCLWLAARKDREFSALTALTWLVSLLAGLTLARWGQLALPAFAGLEGAAMLAPVCLLGFLLCPYLDLTFHHALQRAEADRPGSARLAFGVGFLVVFASMIGLSLLYATMLASPDTAPAARRVLGVHVMLQLVITALLHHVRAASLARQLGLAPSHAGRPRPGSTSARAVNAGPPLLAMLALGFIVGLLAFLSPWRGGSGAWSLGEYLYRGFFVFYGLLFPAYVLFRIASPVPGSFQLLFVTVLLALPLYALGFYSSHTVFLGAGAAVVMLGWMVSGLRPPTRPAPPSPPLTSA